MTPAGMHTFFHAPRLSTCHFWHLPRMLLISFGTLSAECLQQLAFVPAAGTLVINHNALLTRRAPASA
jgi:hypothetical protein